MELLVILFAVAGAVWLIPLIERDRLLVVALVTLGVGTVFGPEFFAIEGPVRISLDRILWIAMFGLAVVGCIVTARTRMGRLDQVVVERLRIIASNAHPGADAVDRAR